MAVSKTQNERPAILALIDLANQLEGESNTHARSIETLTEGLAAEVRDRSTADTALTNSIGETNQQVLELAEDISSILAQLENIKFGMTVEITVPASDSYEGSYVYPEPFAPSANSLVMLGFANAPLQDTLSLALVDSTYSGFSYSITNTDTDPATAIVGYLAIAAIPLS